MSNTWGQYLIYTSAHMQWICLTIQKQNKSDGWHLRICHWQLQDDGMVDSWSVMSKCHVKDTVDNVKQHEVYINDVRCKANLQSSGILWPIVLQITYSEAASLCHSYTQVITINTEVCIANCRQAGNKAVSKLHHRAFPTSMSDSFNVGYCKENNVLSD